MPSSTCTFCVSLIMTGRIITVFDPECNRHGDKNVQQVAEYN